MCRVPLLNTDTSISLIGFTVKFCVVVLKQHVSIMQTQINQCLLSLVYDRVVLVDDAHYA